MNFNGETKLLALIGKNAFYTKSPFFHNTYLEENRINAVYLYLDFQKEEEAFEALEGLMKSSSFLGANITIPYKKILLKRKDILFSKNVLKAQGGNTLYQKEGIWHFENTDIFGIEKTILFMIKKYNILLEDIFPIFLGTGASCESCCLVFEKLNVKNAIFISREKKEISFIQKTQTSFLWNDFSFLDKILSCKIPFLIQTTPLSHHTLPTEVEKWLKTILLKFPQGLFFDLTYTPSSFQEKLPSSFLYQNGEMMFEAQAQESMKLWLNKSRS